MHIESIINALHDRALFVSWKTKDGTLRGCMGTFAPIHVGRDLAHYAVARCVRSVCLVLMITSV